MAEVYKCPGADGSISFADKMCFGGYIKRDGEWISVKEEAKKETEKRERLETERNEKERMTRKHEEEARMREEKPKKQASNHQNTTLESQSIPMSFRECLSRKVQVIASLGVNLRDVIPLVNTNIMTMDRICTSDGSILISCSKPDKKMIVTNSSAKRGVGCR